MLSLAPCRSVAVVPLWLIHAINPSIYWLCPYFITTFYLIYVGIRIHKSLARVHHNDNDTWSMIVYSSVVLFGSKAIPHPRVSFSCFVPRYWVRLAANTAYVTVPVVFSKLAVTSEPVVLKTDLRACWLCCAAPAAVDHDLILLSLAGHACAVWSRDWQFGHQFSLLTFCPKKQSK